MPSHLAFPAIEDELSGDWAVAVIGLGAFLLVDQMAILLRDSFLAVLDSRKSGRSLPPGQTPPCQIRPRGIVRTNTCFLGFASLVSSRTISSSIRPLISVRMRCCTAVRSARDRAAERLIQQQTADQRFHFVRRRFGIRVDDIVQRQETFQRSFRQTF